MIYFAFIFIMLTPFSYSEVFGVRVLIFQILLGVVAVLYKVLKQSTITVDFDYSLFPLGSLWILSLAYSFFTDVYDDFFAITFFIILLFITIQFNKNFIERLKKFYIYSVFFTAAGVFLQVIAHLLFNLNLFRYELLGGERNAYSFLWQDYSFISLYLVSAIPLIWQKKIDAKIILIALLLLCASIATSARTGVMGLFLFIFILFCFYFLKPIATGRLNKRTIYIGIIFGFISAFIPILLSSFTGRQFTGSSSGRLDGFVIGYDFFSKNVFFGALFDKVSYSQSTSVVPHNLFLYMLFMGGAAALILYMIWIFSAFYSVRKSDKSILAALACCFLGFQFIPSFFSAYFMAILIGIALVSSKSNAYKIKSAKDFDQ